MKLEDWLKNIFSTQEQEISCTECFDLVSQFVDLELSGGDTAGLAQVKQHLSQCPACREEYEALRDLRRMEEEGDPPFPDEDL
ncbi:MAG: anti-sigma factor family protein [Bacteroidota bacterium]